MWFTNSVILTAGGWSSVTVVAFLAAFAFAKMSFRGRSFIMNLIISLMVIPVAVLIVPLFVLYTRTKLMSTYPGLIIIYAAVCLPFSVYLLTNFFRTVADEILEAGVIDGCSVTQLLSRIVLPLSGPPITTLIVVECAVDLERAPSGACLPSQGQSPHPHGGHHWSSSRGTTWTCPSPWQGCS